MKSAHFSSHVVHYSQLTLVMIKMDILEII